MAFCSPKACGGVGSLFLPFSFCQPCMTFRAVVPTWLPAGTTAYRQGGCYHFHSGLVEGWKSVELLIMADNSLIYRKIHSKQSLNKSVSPNKRMWKEKASPERCAVASSFHQPLCVVGGLLRLYVIIYQYFFILIQQFNRISKSFQQSFRDGVVPAHASSCLVTVCAAVLVGGIGKTVGRGCQLPALLHHLPIRLQPWMPLLARQEDWTLLSGKQGTVGNTLIFWWNDESIYKHKEWQRLTFSSNAQQKDWADEKRKATQRRSSLFFWRAVWWNADERLLH